MWEDGESSIESPIKALSAPLLFPAVHSDSDSDSDESRDLMGKSSSK